MNKKILIISNNPVNLDSNNGITILNLLSGIKREELINFYIANTTNNLEYCSSYFQITDRDILRSCFIRKLGKIVKTKKINESSEFKKIKKTSIKVYIRNLMWSITNNRQYKTLYSWVKYQKPKFIILQIGDFPSIIKIARKISKKFNIKLLIFNTENYYFKNFNYFSKNNRFSITYFLFRRSLKKQYNLIGNSATWFHLTDSICEKYSKIFHQTNHYVIRKSPDIKYKKYKSSKNRFNIYYFGNLNLGRLEEILKISEKSSEISNKIKIIVYSKLTSLQKKVLSERANITVYNFINQNDLFRKIQKDADLVMHVESFDPKRRNDLEDAFSTKIVDCLNCGVPFLLYSPDYFSCTKYLKSYDCCFICNEQNLKSTLHSLFTKPDQRTIKITNAKNLISLNHNKELNNQLIKKELNI